MPHFDTFIEKKEVDVILWNIDDKKEIKTKKREKSSVRRIELKAFVDSNQKVGILIPYKIAIEKLGLKIKSQPTSNFPYHHSNVGVRIADTLRREDIFPCEIRTIEDNSEQLVIGEDGIHCLHLTLDENGKVVPDPDPYAGFSLGGGRYTLPSPGGIDGPLCDDDI